MWKSECAIDMRAYRGPWLVISGGEPRTRQIIFLPHMIAKSSILRRKFKPFAMMDRLSMVVIPLR